jgi:hypothetical protein
MLYPIVSTAAVILHHGDQHTTIHEVLGVARESLEERKNKKVDRPRRPTAKRERCRIGRGLIRRVS